MHQRLLFCVCVLTLLTLTSCLESKHPISSLEDAEQDARLVGVWESQDPETPKDPKGAGYLHIGAEARQPLSPSRKKPERGLMRFLFVMHEKENERSVIKESSGQFFISKIGDDSYANLRLPLKSSESVEPPANPSFFFIKYKVDGDQLIVWIPNVDPLVKAVKDGALAGNVVSKGRIIKFEELELTASSEELTAFLKTEAGRKIFESEGDEGKLTFRRIR